MMASGKKMDGGRNQDRLIDRRNRRVLDRELDETRERFAGAEGPGTGAGKNPFVARMEHLMALWPQKRRSRLSILIHVSESMR
jgi:hypothetical protein